MRTQSESPSHSLLLILLLEICSCLTVRKLQLRSSTHNADGQIIQAARGVSVNIFVVGVTFRGTFCV